MHPPMNLDQASQHLGRALSWDIQGQLPPLPSLAICASSQTPAALLLLLHDLAHSWRKQPLAIISGFQSPLEDEVWQVVGRKMGEVGAEGSAAVLVRVLARGMLRRWPPQEEAAHALGRLVTLSPFPVALGRATKATAYQRNLAVCALADRVLIPHAHLGSGTAQLTAEILTWGLPVYTLPHPANDHLRSLGVQLWSG